MNRILYCKIGWMKNYTGKQNGNPRRGGAYNDESTGHEIYNFKSYSGKYYGFVGQGKKKTIHIEKLGADKNSESVKNILVVFVATADEKGQYIVGWYKDAFVYRDSKTVQRFGNFRKYVNKIK
ncbi:MAG: hypothetical protein LUG16_06890 [Candidatus Gastranaerophilales bacterium]|nr:hypothetical protein [Candidatus Gastranaerophilales bacterium]